MAGGAMPMPGGEAMPAPERDANPALLSHAAAELPLLGALLAYAAERPARFHMPAHQGGRGAPSPLVAAIGPRALNLDVTGVEGLDDLHQPGGPSPPLSGGPPPSSGPTGPSSW